MNARAPIRVVIDSNVWLSGLVFGGKPGKIIELFIDEAILVIVSEELISELRRKITQRFPLFIPHLDLLEASLRKDTVMVKLGSQTVTVSRDPDDDKFIETALLGECQYIISGDKDLLAIRSYKNIRIIKPAEFLELIHI
jgi:putative PIN family toxin of toxin-antitoxin system